MRWFWSQIQILSRNWDNYPTMKRKFNLTGKGQGGLTSIHSSSHKVLLTTLAMLPFFSTVQAAEDSDSEQAFFLELPVVLTASRLTQPVDEAPNAITIIDRQMIKASGFRRIPELLRLVPGMYVGSQNGHSMFASYHGTTDNFSRRMQVLVDGRSVYLPPYSMVIWDDLPVLLEDNERIEIIRGPAAASHGANSTQGVINIITREADNFVPNEVTVRQGGNGIKDASMTFARRGESFSQRFSAGYRADGGYDLPQFTDDNRASMFNWRAAYHPNGEDTFDFQTGYSQSVRGDGIVGRNQAPDRNLLTEHDYAQLIWTRALAGGAEWQLRYHYTHSAYDDDQVTYYRDGVNLYPKVNVQTQRHDIEAQHTVSWSTGHRLVWGGGARLDGVSSTSLFYYHPAPTLRQWRVFAHDEWRMQHDWLLNVGAMWEDDGMGHHNVSPRVALNYHISPNHTLRIGASLAYRNPAVIEEYGNTDPITPGGFLASGGLQPERMLAREIAYLGHFPETGWMVEARLFSDDLRGQIFLDPLRNASGGFNNASFKNLYLVRYSGWEGSLKYQQEGNALTMNFSRQQAACEADGLPTWISDTRVKGWFDGWLAQCPKAVPTNAGSVLAEHHLTQTLAISAGYYYQDEVQVLDAQRPQTFMHRMDIKITRSFGKRGVASGGEVALVMQNLFRDTHTEYANLPQQGYPSLDRRAYLLATFHY
jgi:iron complex outermembrane receptor protein